MKEAAAQHPQRCETCNKATSKILENGGIRCKGNYLSPDYVKFISEVGCASHSSAAPAADIPGELTAAIAADIAAAVKQEREQVLDELRVYLIDHGVEKRPAGYYFISPAFTLQNFLEHIESLRKQGAQR